MVYSSATECFLGLIGVVIISQTRRLDVKLKLVMLPAPFDRSYTINLIIVINKDLLMTRLDHCNKDMN